MLIRSLLLLVLIPSSTAIALAQKSTTVVEELAWGESLFFHFKDNKIEALTRLSARLSQGRLEKNKQQAELLLAGILLDYGLPVQAAGLLDTLTTLQNDPKTRAKMLLANARVFYQQQQYNAASNKLAEVDFSQLSDRERTQASFMLAQIQFGLGEFSQSANTLSQIRDTGNLSLYAKYNLGISLLNVNDQISQKQAEQVLQQVAKVTIFDQEQYALADQAKLALGMHAINQSRHQDAQQLLLSIRLQGLISDEALLLLGWSAITENQFDQAIAYWTQLAGQSDILSPVVQEAWLAAPYAWQKKGDREKARSGYETAIRIQQRAQSKLQQLKAQPIWRAIIEQNDAEAIAQSQALYQQLVANPAFFELKDQWLELRELDSLLTKKAKLLPVMQLAITEQRERFFSKANSAKVQLQNIDLNAVAQQISEYERQLEQQQDMVIAPGLLAAEEAAIWQRIQRSEDTLALVSENPEYAAKKEQLRLLEGVFHWQFHRNRTAREWQATQSQQQLSNAFQDLQSQHQSLLQIVQQAQPPINVDANKLINLADQISSLKDEIILVSTALEQSMAEVYQAFINERQEALDNLAEQANLSLARLSFEAATQSSNND